MPLTTLDPLPALIVIDLQLGMLDAPTVHPIGDVIARSATLARAFRAHRLPVVLVTVTGGASGRTDRARPSPAVDDPGFAAIVDELDPQPADVRIAKTRRSAFHATSLQDELRSRGVTQVVLCGVSTTSGVEGSARAAFDHDYNVVLAVDAMTDTDPAAHDNAIQRIFPKLGESATTAEILAALDPAAAEAGVGG